MTVYKNSNQSEWTKTRTYFKLENLDKTSHLQEN